MLLNLDDITETLDCLQVERAHAERIDDERTCRESRDRIARIHKACVTLTDKLIEAVNELGG